jgi:Tfp pilus assembly protein PilO
MRTATDLLKRPRVLGTLVALIVITLGWWFAWMVPQEHKLEQVRAQQATQQATVSSLATELAQLRQEAKRVQVANPFLKRFADAIPASPDAPSLVEQVYRLSITDGVTLGSITDDTLDATTSGYSTIPVSITAQGPHDNVIQFVAGLYKIERLLTIQTLNLTGSASVLAIGGSAFTVSIAATAYTTYIAPATGPAAAVALPRS